MEDGDTIFKKELHCDATRHSSGEQQLLDIGRPRHERGSRGTKWPQDDWCNQYRDCHDVQTIRFYKYSQ
jgi:hypothetical protein